MPKVEICRPAGSIKVICQPAGKKKRNPLATTQLLSWHISTRGPTASIRVMRRAAQSSLPVSEVKFNRLMQQLHCRPQLTFGRLTFVPPSLQRTSIKGHSFIPASSVGQAQSSNMKVNHSDYSQPSNKSDIVQRMSKWTLLWLTVIRYLKSDKAENT